MKTPVGLPTVVVAVLGASPAAGASCVAAAIAQAGACLRDEHGEPVPVALLSTATEVSVKNVDVRVVDPAETSPLTRLLADCAPAQLVVADLSSRDMTEFAESAQLVLPVVVSRASAKSLAAAEALIRAAISAGTSPVLAVTGSHSQTPWATTAIGAQLPVLAACATVFFAHDPDTEFLGTAMPTVPGQLLGAAGSLLRLGGAMAGVVA